jgi:hypothetical protein
MGIRKNAARLTPTERDNFLRAALTLKNTIANPGAPAAQQISIYDQFVAIHLYTLNVSVPGGGVSNMGHQNSAFGPWHRYYLLRFEQALQAVDPTVTLPYWDWTDHAATQNIIFQDNFMGPNGGVGGVGGGNVRSGYFAFDAPGSGTNPTPLPAWWPAGLLGWRVKTQLQQGHGSALGRSLSPFTSLETKAHVLTCLARPNYENPSGFRPYLEGGASGNGMHNGMHGWGGGNMGDPNSSPNDLIFFMHHCNIDRLWAMWQIDGHQGSAFYPSVGRPQGHNLNDPMWPWVGGLAGYSSNNAQTNIVLPDFTGEPVRHPADVLDHRALGFAYDTEVVLGIALDQTGSMAGMTPDPMTGMAPNITKWEAAKRGVSAMLHDCEAAYAAAEAYVVGGVETFRSTGAGNTFTQVFPGAHFGVVKNGGAISQVNFDANIAAQSPGGGTPLAGALTDTDTNLVRAPFSNLPAGEQRYLSILTDGVATAPPPLTSLGTPAFPDTVIFAMGFGIGGGWDGVDYATIANMVTKGKAAPAGVAQVFHGENAGVIDKFYTNSVAASIGYVPSVDPIFDLYPGEHVHMRFDVTDAEEAFMITAQGFDYSDGNWDFCLMAPSGMHCADTRMEGATGAHITSSHSHGSPTETLAPFLVTMKERQGRCTIFLNRNGAESHEWVGRWYFMAYYKSDPAEPLMIMPSLADFVLPVGAPPVRGPLYSRFLQKPAERLPVRAIAGAPAHQLATGLSGITTTSPDAPCAVSVNIYKRTSRQATLSATAKAPFAGEDIQLTLQLSDLAGGRQDVHTIVARMVAPNHSLGNAVADLAAVPFKSRRQFLNRANTEQPFDLLQYLAEYERLKPEALAIRDEVVEFKQKDDSTWVARIKGNRFPGAYHFGVYVEGIYYPGGEEDAHEGGGKEAGHDHHCCELGPQRFTESLHASIALGIKPDGKQSSAVLHWTAPNKFVVSATLVDTNGNIALPVAGNVPAVTVGGKVVRAKPLVSLTAEHQVEVTLVGRNIEIAPEGQAIKSAGVSVETAEGERLPIKPNENLRVSIEISGNKLKVDTPKFIGDRETRKVFSSGTQEAMKIAMENRQPIATKKEAKDSGFQM